MALYEPITKSSPILITGAAGFVGKNLAQQLKADGYDNLLLYDIDSTPEELDAYTRQAVFVFHLAGVNRPKDPSEFATGNTDFTNQLLGLLQKHKSKATIILSSSTQAVLDNDYGRSKKAAEDAVLKHQDDNGSIVFVFRLPGVFGKWCKPDYNSVVATFCHHVANDDPISVHDPEREVLLCYIDDVIATFISTAKGRLPMGKDGFCTVHPTYAVSLGNLANLIQGFKQSRSNLYAPNSGNPFEAKLYATFLSYLPANDFSYSLKENVDERGSFTEFIRTPERGQVSVNVTKPGVVKGNHWHNTKTEKFLVVCGKAVIRFRKLGSQKVMEYKVGSQKLEVVDIPPGYTHNIENIGENDLITVMWASEAYNPNRPDTYSEKV
jgi:UDP-2-acetamido-2,6-beta-L-arabino-hexul-4-ose reductase